MSFLGGSKLNPEDLLKIEIQARRIAKDGKEGRKVPKPFRL